MKKKLNLFLLFFVLTLFMFLIVLNNNYFHIITVKTVPEETVVFENRISPGQKIGLAYVHSVAQTPVWEFLGVDRNGNLILIETHFYDHGAGLPYTAFGEELFVSEDHMFKIKNMNRKIDLPLYYRIYQDRGNILQFENHEIRLSDTIGDALLAIDVYRLNVFKYSVRYIMNLGGIEIDGQY
ncbi:MAG: DUF1850 domain-containing protein [Candidatus Atribacteria bacterium]|nr:DUF1850 domain-containing protein [Candidatus Atribacteria bacterium]